MPVAPLTPVYQEVWFIAIMAIMALILLFIVLAVCVRVSGATLPYIRERMPLQARQQNAALPLAYCGPRDASIVTTVSIIPGSTVTLLLVLSVIPSPFLLEQLCKPSMVHESWCCVPLHFQPLLYQVSQCKHPMRCPSSLSEHLFHCFPYPAIQNPL